MICPFAVYNVARHPGWNKTQNSPFNFCDGKTVDESFLIIEGDQSQAVVLGCG